MSVIMANLQSHLREYDVDERVRKIDAMFKEKDGYSPRTSVGKLEQYIQVMLDIIDDVESGKCAIQHKQQMALGGGPVDVEDSVEVEEDNIDSANLLGSNLKSSTTTTTNTTTTKKKTRKANKYGK